MEHRMLGSFDEEVGPREYREVGFSSVIRSSKVLGRKFRNSLFPPPAPSPLLRGERAQRHTSWNASSRQATESCLFP
jgi:hypothetical protein